MNLKGLLKRYTVDQLKEAIKLKAQFGLVEVLEAKRAKLLKAVAKLDRKLASLNGAPARRVPGRPPRVGKPGAVKRRFRFSKATRLKMAASQRARWAKVKGPLEGPKEA